MPLRDLGLKKLWSAVKAGNRSDSGGGGSSNGGNRCEEAGLGGGGEDPEPRGSLPACSLPLLQVWPSQDSPRGEADGQSFVFPTDDGAASSGELGLQHDSGIDSVQVSPSSGAIQCAVVVQPPAIPTSSPSPTAGGARRPSSALLHPDHARLLRAPSSPDQASVEDMSEFPVVSISGFTASCSSSTTSSMTSVAAAVTSMSSRTSDQWLQQDRDRRRSSTMTARYSLLDALDLEYALLRAAARGSVGPYSLSESLHKLTFTQSLAFPALARGLAGKRRRSNQTNSSPLDPSDTGLNAFAKVITALVLMLVSVLVFGVVYKYVRT
ncbi:hypothetical protein B7P43_G05269 [Cryptotermes secundus]|uniref:Uncharacterized protein n=2 Tax=Cryptotermes secundus TaxID=105785 RepID=A0A2J7PUN6_9NEOP|nr:hypothetical protein B7P43_G05269 [Cryptotermes secundus]